MLVGLIMTLLNIIVVDVCDDLVNDNHDNSFTFDDHNNIENDVTFPSFPFAINDFNAF